MEYKYYFKSSLQSPEITTRNNIHSPALRAPALRAPALRAPALHAPALRALALRALALRAPALRAPALRALALRVTMDEAIFVSGQKNSKLLRDENYYLYNKRLSVKDKVGT